MNYKSLLPALIFLVVSFYSCEKPDEYPLIPAIEFKSISVLSGGQGGADNRVFVTISFTDGDGDIGYHSRGSSLNDPIFDDPTSQYFNNFIVKTMILQSGIWNSIDTPVSARIPYLTPEGANKALRGEIQRELNLPLFLFEDTLRYEIFIYDRALNRSNTITTSPVIITTCKDRLPC